MRVPAPFADRQGGPRRVWAASLVLVLLAACASGPTEIGQPLPLERLSRLAPGQSTRAEVLDALGQPQGKGAGRLPGLPLQDLLLYESDTVDGAKMRMKMLIVFVNPTTGRCEGYLWFNSGQVMSPAR